MDGITVSLVTLIVTVVISFLVAVIVKLISAILGRLAKPQTSASAQADTLVFSDQSEIAAAIAVALTLKK